MKFNSTTVGFASLDVLRNPQPFLAAHTLTMFAAQQDVLIWPTR
jgi:hypothetical protein